MTVNDYLAASIGYLSNVTPLIMALGAVAFADLIVSYLVWQARKIRNRIE